MTAKILKMRTPLEEVEQAMTVSWARAARCKYPQLRWLFAVPNGGLRNIVVARKLKAAGVEPGVPDLLLLYPITPWHGAAVEMKRIGGGLTDSQEEWREHLQGVGYAYCMAEGFDAARSFLLAYLNGTI